MVCAGAPAYRPAAHEWQVLPEDAWNLPTPQSSHRPDCTSANRPPAQAAQPAALYAALKVPGAHEAQPCSALT